VSVVGAVGTKEEVERVKDVAPGLAQVLGRALAKGQEIINKYIDVDGRGSCWFQGPGRWYCWGRWCCESFQGMSQGLAGDPQEWLMRLAAV
jgi:hypothetical protein